MTNSPADPPASSPAGADNLVYFNGIDGETGQYAVAPRTIDDMANIARANLRLTPMTDVRSETGTRGFGLVPSAGYQDFDETGWGVIFHENAAAEIRAALEPLLASRKTAARTCSTRLTTRPASRLATATVATTSLRARATRTRFPTIS
jgi:hypothetical protein